MAKRQKIGYILLAAGLVDRKQMENALRRQAVSGGRLGDILIEMGALSEENLARALSKQLGLPFVDLEKTSVPEDLMGLLSANFLLKHRVIPIRREGNIIKVAMANPLDHSTINDVEFITGGSVQPMVTTPSAVENFLKSRFLKTIDEQETPKENPPAEPPVEITEEKDTDVTTRRIKNAAEAQSVVKTVNKILFDAIKAGAANIHIEPKQKDMFVRYRIDGVLRNTATLPAQAHPVIISRLKMIAGMNVSASSCSQEGRAEIKLGGREIELLTSTVPTLYGEKMVIKIRDNNRKLRSLEDLDMISRNFDRYRLLLSRPHGVILVAGPSRSGKSATLYASLASVYSEAVNVITLEESVKYRVPGINQVQVNEESGLGFAAGLSAILRQDPDVIMVGKLRDRETAEIACLSSLRGQRVLSAVYARNAVSAITWLMNIDIKPYLVASALTGVIAKRLIRRSCQHCLENYVPDRGVLAAFNIGESEPADRFYRGKGCQNCGNGGYSGQIAIYEILTVDDTLRELILRRAPEREMWIAARKAGMATLEENGLYLALKKLTTLEELLRVISADDITSKKKENWDEKIITMFEG